jgi:hypothetical protein
MMSPSAPDSPVYSLAGRRIAVILLAIPLIAVFVVMVLHHKAHINIEDFGIPENWLYYGGLAVVLIGVIPIFAIWRCPGCGKYLGKKAKPPNCAHCGARFE